MAPKGCRPIRCSANALAKTCHSSIGYPLCYSTFKVYNVDWITEWSGAFQTNNTMFHGGYDL